VAGNPPDSTEFERHADRGDDGPTEDQGIDPRAADTWVGSGAAADLLSVVAGTFLPVEQYRGFAGRISDRIEAFADEIAGRAEAAAGAVGAGGLSGRETQPAYGEPPEMTTLSLRPAQPDYKLAEGQGILASPHPIPAAKPDQNRDGDAAGSDRVPDGDEILEAVSERVYELLMEEMEQSFDSR
jgi:hypothetical protein